MFLLHAIIQSWAVQVWMCAHTVQLLLVIETKFVCLYSACNLFILCKNESTGPEWDGDFFVCFLMFQLIRGFGLLKNYIFTFNFLIFLYSFNCCVTVSSEFSLIEMTFIYVHFVEKVYIYIYIQF